MPSFMGACKDFFGLLPDQTFLQFGKEVQQLSQDERIEIAQGLRKLGIDCDDPPQKS
jgi:hypothetical protein